MSWINQLLTRNIVFSSVVSFFHLLILWVNEVRSTTARSFWAGSLLFACSVSSAFCSDAKPHEHMSLVGIHGMALFSDHRGNWYISHLPLYSPPHNYQIIYSVSTPDKAILAKLPADSLITILPEQFDLTQLLEGYTFTLAVDFYAGHFEREGIEVGKGTLNFTKQIYARHIDSKELNANGDFTTIKIEHGQFIVHQIGRPPSFDAIAIRTSPPLLDKSLKCDVGNNFTQSDITAITTGCLEASPVYIETMDFQ